MISLSIVVVAYRLYSVKKIYQVIYKQIDQNNNITTHVGRVINDPVIVANKQKVEIKPTKTDFPGIILYYFSGEVEIEHGDLVEILCQLKVPPEFDDFSYKDYLATKKVLAVCYQPQLINIIESDSFPTRLLRGKHLFSNKLQQIYPYKQALLVSGMLLGVEESFPDSLKQELRQAGLLHLVVVSGANLALVIALFYNGLLYLKVKRSYALLTGLSFLLIYCFLVGFNPPVMRAAIMAVVTLLSSSFYRPATSLKVLIITSFIMIVFNPYLLLSASFQLSVAATFGLTVFLPKINLLMRRKKLKGYVWESLATTCSAQLAVFPILWYQFRSFNPLIIIPNTLVAFVPPIVMILGLISGLMGFISMPLSQAFGWANYLVMGYFFAVVNIFS